MSISLAVRALTDALGENEWLSLAEIAKALAPAKYMSVAAVVGQMVQRQQLRRRGKAGAYKYRSGPKPMTPHRHGSKKRPVVRLGFRALARLEQSDPTAYAKAIAAERRRGRGR